MMPHLAVSVLFFLLSLVNIYYNNKYNKTHQLYIYLTISLLQCFLCCGVAARRQTGADTVLRHGQQYGPGSANQMCCRRRRHRREDLHAHIIHH